MKVNMNCVNKKSEVYRGNWRKKQNRNLKEERVN